MANETIVARTMDGLDLHRGDMYECAYCNAELPAETYDAPVPDIDDNAAWSALADLHNPGGCEWIETRAHRIGQQ